MRGIVMTAMVLAAWSVGISTATAATLEVRQRWVWNPGTPYSAHLLADIVYDGAGTESNHVTVAPQSLGTGIVLTDPGIPISTRLSTPEIYVPDPTIHIAFTCWSPGTSIAACEAYPGSRCDEGGCGYPDLGYYNGLIKIAGNSGDDEIRILPSGFNSEVWGVYGDDTIDVRNGRIDNVSCGDGADTATVDVKDLVLDDCETVTRG